MDPTIIISGFIIVTVLAIIFVAFSKASKLKESGGLQKRPKEKSVLMKEASRRLSQDPNDIQGLMTMGDISYKEQNWEKAYASYSALIDRMKSLEMNKQFDISLRYGISALKTNRLPEAKKGLVVAETINAHHFEVNYTLGYIYYMEKAYEKALPYFRKALIAQPNNPLATKYLGFTLQRLRKYSDAMPSLKKALDTRPDDKEGLFAMGECFYETGADDKCLKQLSRLRADPVFGPQSSLYTGLIRAKSNQLDQAVEDFRIGLKHTKIPLDVSNELKYRLAQTLIKMQNIGQAVQLLREIQSVSPGYKDTTTLIKRYQELNQNKSLQTYLMAGQSEFVGLCRKIVARFYPKAKVKILDITVLTAHTDIVAEIDAPRFSDTVIFRFFRSQGTVGELLLRDFHSRLRETKGGTGVCMTAGTFTEEAVRYVEGRPIDLYDKAKLSGVLNSLN